MMRIDRRYRKKPVEITAVQYTGNNIEDIRLFARDKLGVDVDATGERTVFIHTLEGNMEISPGDYVIKGVDGEFYPCKPGIFWKTYEEVPYDD
jgi:hypothetical protein